MKVFIDNKLIVGEVMIADTFLSRFVGLLNRNFINGDEGLFLKKCSSIHCFFMKFSIDAVYLSKDMQVLYKETLKPWEIGKIVKNTKHILELKEGKSSEVNVGDYIDLID